MIQKITPFLWFDGKGEEAMLFYVSIFPNSKVKSVTRYGDAAPGQKGAMMMGEFELEGVEFYAMNGGPQFQFSPAVSFFVKCETQEEVDHYWGKLSQGGVEQRCGWLQDRYGVSWQIVPTVLGEYLRDRDPMKSRSVMSAMMRMVKMDIGILRKAYEEA